MTGDPYDFALKIAREGGEMVLRALEKGFETMVKGGDPRDIVTSVDDWTSPRPSGFSLRQAALSMMETASRPFSHISREGFYG